MRLAGQAKGGYYAADPKAVALALEFLEPPEGGGCVVFDPCAGEGAAIKQLAGVLGAEPYAIELSEDRAKVVLGVLPEENVLAPASFFGCRISPKWASLIWCNPPFDHSTGGGRVELEFVSQCISMIAPHGVLALVCPEDEANEHKMLAVLSEHFETDTMFAVPFPTEVRHYNEMIVLCQKKATPGRDKWCNYWELWPKLIAREHVFTLPPGRVPPRYVKTELTDAEVVRALRESPLRRLLQTPPELPLPRPPISPGQGHRALLLAAGFIDGVIEPPDEPPHVVRGTCRKQSYVSEQSTSENEDGSTTTKTVTAEKVQLVVRALDHEGTIHTLLQE